MRQLLRRGLTQGHRSSEEEALKTILIVEDTEFNIDLLVQLLEEDYNLLIAKDGVQGVEMTEKHHPDLVLMDIAMPLMDGYDATRKIRETFKNLPVIGLSSHAMTGDKEKAIAAGCTDYITKPIDEDELIKVLRRHLG